MRRDEPRAVPMPPESRIGGCYVTTDLADAFAIDLPPGVTRDPESLARFIFSCQPRWVAALMAVRDACVSLLGLKTGRGLRSLDGERDRIGIFRLYQTLPTEVIIGEDDRHLDFRASVLHRAQHSDNAACVVLSTVVHCHGRLGRTYLWLIAPFHRRVVRSFLRQAAASGWPRADVGAA